MTGDLLPELQRRRIPAEGPTEWRGTGGQISGDVRSTLDSPASRNIFQYGSEPVFMKYRDGLAATEWIIPPSKASAFAVERGSGLKAKMTWRHSGERFSICDRALNDVSVVNGQALKRSLNSVQIPDEQTTSRGRVESTSIVYERRTEWRFERMPADRSEELETNAFIERSRPSVRGAHPFRLC